MLPSLACDRGWSKGHPQHLAFLKISLIASAEGLFLRTQLICHVIAVLESKLEVDTFKYSHHEKNWVVQMHLSSW
jgi:hypothetical protein